MSRNVGLEVPCNLICWESSYSFLTSRQIWFLFYIMKLIFTEKESTSCSLFDNEIYSQPPTQGQHEITCCHNCRGDEVEEADQAEDWGGVSCKGKYWKYGG